MSDKTNVSSSNVTNTITGSQVVPLPIGPGGDNTVKNQFNDLNAQLTMMTAQATANSKYDPPTPKPITKPMIVEKFTNHQLPTSLAVVGVLFFVYGMCSK
jgi:hypothetical protein